MSYYNNLKVGAKITGGFILVTLILIGVIAYNLFEIQNLGVLQDAGAQRAVDAQLAARSSADALELYQVIANAQLNLDFQASAQDWSDARQMTEADIDKMEEAADTPDEKAWIQQARDAYQKIVSLYETRMLPALKASNATTAETVAMDGEIDRLVTRMRDPLSKYEASLVAETIEGDQDFDATRRQVTSISLFASILAAVVAILLGLFTSRNITRPLGILTHALQNIQHGDLNRGMSDEQRSIMVDREDELGQAGKAEVQTGRYLREIADVAAHVADGDLTVKVTPRSDKDELGLAFSHMVNSLGETVGKVADNAHGLMAASQQLAQAATQAGQATNQISTTVQQVARGTTQQSEAVSHTASSVEQMGRAIDGVAHGAQEQSHAVIKASEVTAEITKAIQQVSGNAQAVTHDSAGAAEAARSGAQTVAQTVEGMRMIKAKVGISVQKVQEMGQRSDQVGAIVETIEDIASQTNLLALNAAIEAARAGEHGKGFAVVADEVRKLAERATSATKEIGGLIRGIQKTVAEAVTAMEDGAREVESGVVKANEAGQALKDILTAAEAVYQQATQAAQAAERMGSASSQLVSAVDSVSAVVEENTAATEEMAASSSEVTRAIENIASVSEENSAAMEQVSASAEEMSAQVEEVTASAHSLAEMAGILQQVVAQFKISNGQRSISDAKQTGRKSR